MTDAMIELLAAFKYLVLTITADNGKELQAIKSYRKSLNVAIILLMPIALGNED